MGSMLHVLLPCVLLATVACSLLSSLDGQSADREHVHTYRTAECAAW